MDHKTLVEVFVTALRPWVEARVAELGIGAVDGLDDSVDAAQAWLREQLDELAELPFGEQRRGPLELLQEAMRFPTAVLADTGLPPIERDEAVMAALPGDSYGLAPASSRQLGEDAWRAHLAWGVAKAAAIQVGAAPVLGVFTANLLDRSKFETGVPGWNVVTWKSVADISDPPPACFVDLQASGADEAIRKLTAAGARVIAFGPHVDDLAMVRARSLGAADALPRSRFFLRLPDLLPKVM